MRLGAKMLVLFASTSALIALAFGWVVYARLWNDRLTLIQDSISQQLLSFDFSLKDFFASVEGDVKSLADNEVVRSRDDSNFTNFLQADEKTFKYEYTDTERRIIRILDTHRLTHPYANAVYMGRENGSFVRSHPREPTRYDPRDRPWYLLAKSEPERVMKTDAYASLTTPDINIGVVKALVDESGKVFGVLGIDVTLANLTRYVLSFKIRPAGKIFLLDRNSVVLASQDTKRVGRRIDELSPEIPALLAKEDRGIVTLDVQGQESILFHQRSAEQDWRIAVLIRSADIDAQVRGPVLWIVLSLLAGLALLSFLTLIGLHFFIIRPLRKLTRETEYVKSGDLDRRIAICSRDEMGDLANSYNEMIGSLGESQKSLLEKEKDLTAYRDHLEELVGQRTMEIQSALKELAVARDRAEAADRLKSAFLATMSHELRTPLNSIIGFTGIILQGLAGPLNGEQRKQLEMVRDSARHLLALINDVLDISKIEARQMEVRTEVFDLGASIEKVVGIVRPLAEKKNLMLTVELSPQIGAFSSDARRIEQVLLNLLNNAIKFSERGSITLTAEILPGRLRTVHSAIHISIADTGIGIKPEDMDKLFAPFVQIDSGLTRQHEGTGLGLAICQRLANLLGGEIYVESQWGKGSIFTLALPMKEAVRP